MEARGDRRDRVFGIGPSDGRGASRRQCERHRSRGDGGASGATRGCACRRRPLRPRAERSGRPGRGRSFPGRPPRERSAERAPSAEQLADQVDQPARVSPLVVVPAEDLDARPVHHRELAVEDARERAAVDVRRDDGILRVLQDPGEVALGSSPKRIVDLVDRRLAPERDDEVGERATVATGARTEMPSTFPWSSGRTRPIAFAAPVVVGIRLMAAARARRRSLCGKSSMT